MANPWRTTGGPAIPPITLLAAPLLAQEAPSDLPDALQSKLSTWTERPTHWAFALGRTGACGSADAH